VRVVMLVHNTINRGTFNRAHSLARHLVKRGHYVTLFTGAQSRGESRSGKIDGVTVIESFDPLSRRARESGLSPFDFFGRMQSFRKLACDLIHCFDHRPAASFPGLFFAKTRRVPCVFDWADLWGFEGIAGERGPLSRLSLGMVDQLLENTVRRRANSLTVINTALRDRARAKFSAPIHLLPVGANSDVIKPLPKLESRRRLGLPENASIAVHTGQAPYDAVYLARSFIELAKTNPGTLLVLAGGSFPTLTRALGQAGLSQQLVQLGMLDPDNFASVMACADVLLLPYTNRAVNRFRYPNKLGDYLAAGRPIVTNRTGDLGRLVAEEQVALIAEDTPESFAKAMKQLFDNESLREELGRRGRKLAESKLDWGFFAAGLERFYEETVARAC
jgi:glycosyltransferase involved in cell wall biosynthesis